MAKLTQIQIDLEDFSNTTHVRNWCLNNNQKEFCQYLAFKCRNIILFQTVGYFIISALYMMVSLYCCSLPCIWCCMCCECCIWCCWCCSCCAAAAAAACWCCWCWWGWWCCCIITICGCPGGMWGMCVCWPCCACVTVVCGCKIIIHMVYVSWEAPYTFC